MTKADLEPPLCLRWRGMEASRKRSPEMAQKPGHTRYRADLGGWGWMTIKSQLNRTLLNHDTFEIEVNHSPVLPIVEPEGGHYYWQVAAEQVHDEQEEGDAGGADLTRREEGGGMRVESWGLRVGG